MKLSTALSILGVKKTDGLEQVQKKWRTRSNKTHPDRYPEDKKAEAEEEFKLVQEAWETLCSFHAGTFMDPEMQEAFTLAATTVCQLMCKGEPYPISVLTKGVQDDLLRTRSQFATDRQKLKKFRRDSKRFKTKGKASSSHQILLEQVVRNQRLILVLDMLASRTKLRQLDTVLEALGLMEYQAMQQQQQPMPGRYTITNSSTHSW